MFECDICGRYTMIPELLNPQTWDIGHWSLSPLQRAVLSHRIRICSEDSPTAGSHPFTITPGVLNSLRSNGKLPNFAVQAANLIRFVGDYVVGEGHPILRFPIKGHHAIIGAIGREAAIRLTRELVDRKILTTEGWNAIGPDPDYPSSVFVNVNLSLDGWERYEAEKRGRFEGTYGFIAMQFGDSSLASFVEEVVKPAVKGGIGYDLVDMNDVARAGVIDNIMRTQIRDAAFVIVDLTHDNPGAYWEAGYAEGLGKPVIYICERGKFEDKKTHFDTNHCTTVPWSRDDDEGFRKELTATLRRSLD